VYSRKYGSSAVRTSACFILLALRLLHSDSSLFTFGCLHNICTLHTAKHQSTKLAYAFQLLDEDNDGVLSRRGLWRYIRAVLTALMAFSYAATTLSAEEVSICQ
jgi:Ca2+-binding EF-hand superfamily protein